MNEQWLDRWIDVWSKMHQAGDPVNGAPIMEGLLSLMTEDAEYWDNGSDTGVKGHDQLRTWWENAYVMSHDASIKVLSRQTNGTLFAIEFEWWGTSTGQVPPLPAGGADRGEPELLHFDARAEGRPFRLKAASLGTFAPDGRVNSQRDYWDLFEYFGQLGMLPVAA